MFSFPCVPAICVEEQEVKMKINKISKAIYCISCQYVPGSYEKSVIYWS